MKKLIAIVSLIGLAFMAQAQNHQTYSFLDARSVLVTNLVGITNLTALSATRTTNLLGTIFTNGSGTRVIISGTANGTLKNLLKTVPLPQPRNADLIIPIYTNQAPGLATMAGPYLPASIYLRVVGGSGANVATAFVFAAVPNKGVAPLTEGVDSTAAADILRITITPNTTTEVTSTTPIDARQFIGAYGLKLVSITAGDTDASSDVTVLECTINGYYP